MSLPEPLRILYVEDDPAAASLFQKLLQRLGYVVDLAEDGEEGLFAWDTGYFDILALNHDMPGLTGLEMIRRLAARGTLPLTIMFTGEGSENVAIEAMRLGADDYIIKDTEARYLETVPQRIERARDKRRLLKEKQRVEAELKERDRRYRQIVAHANDSIHQTDVHGYFTLVNPVTVRRSGYSEEELLGKHFLELIHPDFREEAGRFYGAQFADRVPESCYEFPIVTKDGETIWVEQITQTLMEHDRVVGYQSIGRDITERKTAEEALRVSEERLELALRGADLGFWDVDLQTGEQIHDQRWADMLGYSAEELEPHISTWKNLVHPDDLPKVEKVLKAHLEGAAPFYECEYRLRTKSGDWKWIRTRGRITVRDKSGTQLRMTGTHLDISDGKRAEQIFREGEKTFTEFVASLPQFVFEIDLTGKLTFFNRAGAAATGYSMEEFQSGLYAGSLFVPEDRERIAADLMRALHGETLSGCEYTCVRKDGSTFPMITYTSPMKRGGRIVGLRGLGIDITKRKAAEERIKKDLKEKSVMLNEIHHRVRNNLAVVTSLLGLQSDYASDESRARMLQDCQARIRSMSLAHDLLYDSKNLGEINMDNYVGSLIDNLVITLGGAAASVEFKKEIEGVFFGLDTAVPLGLVLTELIANCLKHAFPDQEKGLVRISIRAIGEKRFELVVGDNGVGTPESLDPENPESLGLELVNVFAQQIKGEMEITRETGTQVRITFKELEPSTSGGHNDYCASTQSTR
jgi:PAS domain S-box-containing protein